MEALLTPPAIMWLTLGVCFLVGVTLKAVTTIAVTHAREKSRREIAAYIAEGSITPEQGERILAAEVRGRRACGV